MSTGLKKLYRLQIVSFVNPTVFPPCIHATFDCFSYNVTLIHWKAEARYNEQRSISYKETKKKKGKKFQLAWMFGNTNKDTIEYDYVKKV
jgi:hypothetical protein